MQTSPYGISVKLNLPYEQAVAKTREALKAEGYGVITEIDVKKRIKDKLGIEFRPYIILGARNPALAAEPEVGRPWPSCNVNVYGTNGGATVSAVDAAPRLGQSDKPEVPAVAQEVRQQLQRLMERVES